MTELEMVEKRRKLILFNYTAREKAIMKIASEYWREKLMNDPTNLIDYYGKSNYDDVQKYVVKRQGRRYKWTMFTINFKDGTPIDEIMKKCDKIVTKKWVVKYTYCIECRNYDDYMPTGLHAHMRIEIEKSKKPYDCKREIYNTVKWIVGNKLHVNVRYSNVEGCFLDYIAGFKKGEEKEGLEMNEDMRSALHLKDIYSNELAPSDLLTGLAPTSEESSGGQQLLK